MKRALCCAAAACWLGPPFALQPATQRLSEKQLKAQRELFVGNLAPGSVTEQSLYQVFHSALVAAFPQASQPGQEQVIKVRGRLILLTAIEGH